MNVSSHTVNAVERACIDLARDGRPLTFTAIATAAGLSRSTLYRNTALRALVEHHKHAAPDRPLTAITDEIATLRAAVSTLAERVRRRTRSGPSRWSSSLVRVPTDAGGLPGGIIRSSTDDAASYPLLMAAPAVITPYADLDELLVELLGHWQRILGEDLAVAFVQGSFALGSGDQHSDCDWLVATHGSLTEPQIAQLRELHDEIPTREGHWCHDLEGSYAPVAELASVGHLGRKWLYNNHGHRTLEWDDHCNRGYTRWILREHGITLTGPTPQSFMPVVPADRVRREAALSLPTLLDDLATWIDIEAIAWGQRYAVVTVCRILYTLDTSEVASKLGALEWALRTLEPRWRPLLAQVRDERELGWDPDRSPHPAEVDAARAFVAYAVARAVEQTL